MPGFLRFLFSYESSFETCFFVIVITSSTGLWVGGIYMVDEMRNKNLPRNIIGFLL